MVGCADRRGRVGRDLARRPTKGQCRRWWRGVLVEYVRFAGCIMSVV